MSRTVAPVEERRNLGIGLVLIAQIFFTMLDTSAKYLSVSGIPVTEVVFIRYVLQLVLLLALVMPVSGFGPFTTRSFKLEVARGLCLLGSTVGNFFAMRYLPLTVTGALLFTMPLIVAAVSGPLLGETIGWRRWSAIGVGFLGILIIVRPGTAAFHPASLLSLGSALSAAFYSILTRKLAGVDSPATQQIYTSLVALCFVTPFAFTGWTWPSTGPGWFAFLAIGVAGLAGHQLVSTAYRFAPPTILAPFSYAELLLLAVASWLIFGEPPDLWFYVGAPLIILSGLYIWLRERTLSRQSSVAQPVD